VTLLRYLDVVLVLVAAPILLLIGVPPAGYLVGGGVWIALRFMGAAVERYAASVSAQGPELTLRVAYLLGRLFVLALTVILVRRGSGRDAGLAALIVIAFAFTVQLAISFATRPRSR
jgi:hypothetical protein